MLPSFQLLLYAVVVAVVVDRETIPI